MEDFTYMRKLLYTFGLNLHLPDVLMSEYKEISQQFGSYFLHTKMCFVIFHMQTNIVNTSVSVARIVMNI